MIFTSKSVCVAKPVATPEQDGRLRRVSLRSPKADLVPDSAYSQIRSIIKQLSFLMEGQSFFSARESVKGHYTNLGLTI